MKKIFSGLVFFACLFNVSAFAATIQVKPGFYTTTSMARNFFHCVWTVSQSQDLKTIYFSQGNHPFYYEASCAKVDSEEKLRSNNSYGAEGLREIVVLSPTSILVHGGVVMTYQEHLFCSEKQ